jgi:ABC-2 type transport system ATP-binding protein
VPSESLAIEVHALHKRYGRIRALRGVSLALPAGQFHVLVGRNGAGKSTLLRILANREPPDRGEARVLGRSLELDVAEHGRDIAFVSESTAYEVPVSMRTFFGEFHRLRPGWQWDLFADALRSLDVDLDKSFSTLSRGQRMQVACAAALADRPKLLLLDEVTSVLDARARPYFVDAFADLCRAGGTVVMATNIVSEVRDVASRLVVLEDGVVRTEARVAELSDRFVKVTSASGHDHTVFSSPGAVALGRGPDGRQRWLVSRDDATSRDLPAELLDPLPVTPEEAFIYFTGKRQ